MLLSEQTQGNPFFVGQVLRHLVETGAIEEHDGRWVRTEGADVFVVPEGVREVIGRRVTRLSPQTGDLLQVAGVAGAEFETAVVTEVAGQPVGEALDSFDEAVGSRLLLETNVPGRLRFAHALVRQTLEDELTTLRRLHLHRDIALAIERRFGDADSAVAELAHHFAEAAAVGEGQRAAHYAGRAAMQATQRGAPGQGADLLDRALDLLGADVDPDGLRRDRLYAQLTFCCDALFDTPRLEDARSTSTPTSHSKRKHSPAPHHRAPNPAATSPPTRPSPSSKRSDYADLPRAQTAPMQRPSVNCNASATGESGARSSPEGGVPRRMLADRPAARATVTHGHPPLPCMEGDSGGATAAFHRCRSVAGADRAPAEAWSSSDGGAIWAPVETPASQEAVVGIRARVSWIP